MKRDQLLDAVKKVESEGLLPSGQGEKVGARLAELLFAPRDTARSAAAIIAWLGGILVAAGVLGFVAVNWEELGKHAKLFLIFATLSGLHFAGYRLGESPGRRPALGHALTGAAMLCFGGAIGLVAQIYNMSSHYPNAILVWWVLTLPFAFLIGTRKLLLIPLALFLVWVHLHIGVWIEDHVRGGGWFWSDAEIFAFGLSELGIAALLAAVAATMTGGATGSGAIAQRFAPTIALVGRLAAFAGLFILAFDDTLPNAWSDPEHARLFDAQRLREVGMALLPFGCLAGAALVAGFATLLRGGIARAGPKLQDAGGAVLAAAAIAAMLFVLPAATFIVANLVVLAAVIALVLRGVARQRPADVNVAVLAFLVTVMARYFEWVGDAGGSFLVFLGAGVLLLALGSFLEKSRRRWVARAHGSTP